MSEAPTMRPFTRHVLICTGSSCDPDAGGERLFTQMGELLGDLRKLRNPCRVKRSTLPCLGICTGGPVIAVYPEGIWYHHVDEALLERIVEEHLKHDRPVEEAIFYRTGDPLMANCPAVPDSASLPDETDEAAAAPVATSGTAPTAEAVEKRKNARRNRTKRGLVLVNTGDGKGKTTASLGVILRMLGRGKRVALIQFLKNEGGQWGEVRALQKLGLEAIKTGDGFTWTSKNIDETQAKALHGWEIAREKIASGEYDLVVLDEFTYLLDFGWLDPMEVVNWLEENKPEALNLIITGRNAPQTLIDYADTVTEMTKIKHAFDAGISARAGIEFRGVRSIMPAKTLMIQGSMSSVGKSLLVTALCRIFARRGVRVAPFKAQNMSNNAAVCADGGEIGRAQYTQALAANVEPSVMMNPVLLKPEGEMRSQVIVNGRVWETLWARDYGERKRALWGHVTAALDALRDQYELVIIEGAGSPVELNLKRGDIVNMAVALYAQSPVLLAGDIDRGGIFAQLLGTLSLLEPDEVALVRGLLVNKFRGDPALFEDGIRLLEERSGVPVLGVIPHLHDLAIPEEDAVALEDHRRGGVPRQGIDIAVIALPHIANFDDFDPLANEPDVSIRYVSTADALDSPDAIILPGSKSTIADLAWLHERGLSARITTLARNETPVVGICGGYQMLGTRICDPYRVESSQGEVAGLGLLPVETIFAEHKATYQAAAAVTAVHGWMATLNGQTISGYEIHMGQTDGAAHWLNIGTRGGQSVSVPDGAVGESGRIWGCYLHGLFGNDNLRHAWLHSLGWQSTDAGSSSLDAGFDRLADHVEAHLDMQALAQIMRL